MANDIFRQMDLKGWRMKDPSEGFVKGELLVQA